MNDSFSTPFVRAVPLLLSLALLLGACQDSKTPPAAVGSEGKAPVESAAPVPEKAAAPTESAAAQEIAKTEPATSAEPAASKASGETAAVASKPEASPASTPMKKEEPAKEPGTEVITLGGGCFWCVEAVMLRLEGVVKVVSGYMGGHVENPTYEQICTKTTGHAEVVQVTFDPTRITLDEILDVFWQAHDPTTLNRQGADVGPQYRSAVFYHGPEQRNIAMQSMKKLDASGVYSDPAVTEITEASTFWVAEDYHQNYYELNKDKNPYCRVVISPKLKKLGME